LGVAPRERQTPRRIEAEQELTFARAFPIGALQRSFLAERPFLFKVLNQGMSDEAHLSAEQPRPRTASRIPSPDGNRGRPRRDPRPPRTRSQEAVGLNTISARRDFLAANSAKRAATPGFVLLIRDRADGDSTKRLGITVTKKIGGAVIRNRMKRRFRELARDVIVSQGAAGSDHILIGRAGGIERDFATLRADLAKAVAKLAR
jgi:ribonuclease P protein component